MYFEMLLNLIKLKRVTYTKLISTLLKFITDKGRGFSQAFRLLNLDRYTFPIRITIKTVIQVAKNTSLQRERNKFSEKVSNFGINLNSGVFRQDVKILNI